MITVEVKGLAAAQELLATLEAMGNTIGAAQVLGHTRHDDPSINNAQVLQWLGEQNPKSGRNTKRDFTVAETGPEIESIHKVFIDELVKGAEKRGIVAGQGTKPISAAAKSQAKKDAKQTMGKALREACKKFLEIVTGHIEKQQWMGGGDTELNEDYAEQKQRKYGFRKPIGKASGQLLDNLAPTAKNIKLVIK